MQLHGACLTEGARTPQGNEPGVFYAAVIIAGVGTIGAIGLYLAGYVLVFRLLQESSIAVVARRRRKLQVAAKLLSKV